MSASRRIVLALLGIMAPAMVCRAQTPVTFAHGTSTSGVTPANIYTVDVNNDGLADVIQDTAQSPSAFSVSINRGNGSFSAPTVYTLPVSSTGPMPIVTEDFNNDANVDIAVPVVGTNQVAVYLGKGDGTFQSAILTSIVLPTGWVFQLGGAVAVDLNHDGCEDLAAWANNNSPSSAPTATAVYTLQGNCAGGFTNPQQALVGPAYQPGFQLFVGDFDSDSHADLLASTHTLDSSGNVNNTTVWALYGNGDLTFDKILGYSTGSQFLIGSGDLNSDGRTDFFGLLGSGSSQQLGYFYGNTNRTFSSYFQTLNTAYPTGAQPAGVNFNSPFTLADFNGDGSMDLAATGFNSSSTEAYTEVFLGGYSAGQFTQENIPLPLYYKWETVPQAGLFSGSYLVPDVVLNQSGNGGPPPQNTPSFLTVDLNQASSGWFGNCTYPKAGEGLNVCKAGVVSGSQALFSANVNSFGKLRKIELWVDGVKVQEQHHTWDQHAYFDWSGTFSPGTHYAVMYAADVDNHLQDNIFTFTIGSSGGGGGNGGSGSCSAPSSPSVNVCSPTNNSTVSSPVQALATANIDGQKLARMEIWVDGVKQYTETTSTTVNISLPLTPGTHKIDFYAVSTAGGQWETTSYVTVSGSGSSGVPQYQAPLLSNDVVDGMVQVDTAGNTSVQLGEATPNTTYTLQFCPAVNYVSNYEEPPCSNVLTLTSNSNGIAAASAKFPQSGDWAGDFYVNDSSGNTKFQTSISPDAANQSYLGTLLPESKANEGYLTTATGQDPLTSGTVTLGNNQITFTVKGAAPDTTYTGVESETSYLDGSGSYAIANLTTDASGNGNTTVSTSTPGDMFELVRQSGNNAGFIAGFSVP